MACGVPVVASRVGSVHEVVAEGETGHVLISAAPETVANRIVELLVRPSEVSRMGSAARAIAVERYDTKLCRDKHIAAYEMALERGRASELSGPAEDRGQERLEIRSGRVPPQNGQELVCGIDDKSDSERIAGRRIHEGAEQPY
jgi:hypothetical protein